MAFFDMPLDKLREFVLPDYEPKDFDAFWTQTLAQAAEFPLAPRSASAQECGGSFLSNRLTSSGRLCVTVSQTRSRSISQ